MRPPHPLKDIAAQAGLSEATVDRALHGRSNVSAAAVRAPGVNRTWAATSREGSLPSETPST